MANAYPYTPILGWSNSRYEAFTTCKRLYYYRYYAKYDPDYSRTRIDRLKTLATVPMVRGRIVHEVIQAMLERLQQSQSPIDRERLWAYAQQKTDASCQEFEFAEIYYGLQQTVDREALFSEVRVCLENLLDSPRYRWVLDTALRFEDRWLVEPPGYGETRIDGLKAYLVVDFLTPTGDGLVILDWKTGGRGQGGYQRQLEAYAAWASLEYGLPLSGIEAFVAYLSPEYYEDRLPSGGFTVADFVARFHRETEEMYGHCVDAELNIPREKATFAMTEKVALCGVCSFRELCSRGMTELGDRA